ncbi:FBD-associated F-box protein At5g38590-like isoform X2 [Triticum aestivum]|uniref:FBD-associated F-box protein At5g38590-like isoform X2 n=1 Tax=Triticum aestivum TaxID=4565 RepID=UPI001D023944|nr:FBD-associated F-box protein At5g38590-like isoform X2 [Triticum aestivum]
MERMPDNRRPKLSDTAGVPAGGGEDRLSALPDDLLIHILLKLCDAPVAARTSILARRWRRVWALLPELDFPAATNPDGIRAALAAHDAPALGRLFVDAIEGEAAPESVAAWLTIAARRLSGVLDFNNRQKMDGSSAASPLKLPCFQNATELHGPCSLSDVVSSPRCPSLRRLCVYDVKGLDKFTIHSESLLELDLRHLPSLQQLNVVAPALQELAVPYGNASLVNKVNQLPTSQPLRW